MNRYVLAWPIATLTVVSLFGLPARADAPQAAATILAIDGPVSWHAANETAFRDATVGLALAVGAVVRTGERGHAKLRWASNGGDFRLMPLTELKITGPDAVETGSGRIWSQFKHKLLNPFFFRSPSATAVVRGTTLGFAVDAGGTRVSVQEGRVEVRGLAGDTRFVTGGQTLHASPRGELGALEPLETPEDSPFDVGAAAQDAQAAAPQSEPKDEPRREARGWARLDDWTRRGLDWLDRHRASERMPAVRQEMITRVRVPQPAQAGQTGQTSQTGQGAYGQAPSAQQAQTPAERTGTSSGLNPAGSQAPAEERPGDAWPNVPANDAGTPATPQEHPGDSWPAAPNSAAEPPHEQAGDSWPKGPPDCANVPTDPRNNGGMPPDVAGACGEGPTQSNDNATHDPGNNGNKVGNGKTN